MTRRTMTWLAANRVKKTALLAGLAALLGSSFGRLVAGEPIVFGSQKVKSEPGKEKSIPQNVFKLEKVIPPQFDAILSVPLPSLNSNPHKDKRQQNKEDEKRN